MTDDYTKGRCSAITHAGKRCSGRWGTAAPVTFKWDPVLGVGLDGPWVVLCWRHDRIRERRRPARMRVFRGWLGGYNQFGYGTCVFARATGWKAAKWWAARKGPCISGGRQRRDAA